MVLRLLRVPVIRKIVLGFSFSTFGTNLFTASSGINKVVLFALQSQNFR